MLRARTMLWMAVAVFAMTAAAKAQAAASGKPASRPATGESSANVQAKLDRRLPEINFNAVPFSDAIDFLRDVTGANIQVNWQRLEAAGIDRNAPISIRVRDVRFEKVLSLIVDDLGHGDYTVGYTVDDGVITILPVPQEVSPAAEQSQMKVQIVNSLRDTCVDPDAMAIVAIGGLRGEVGLSRDQLIATLEQALKERDPNSNNALSTRNALRMTLKDLYLEAGNKDKARTTLVDIISDNANQPRYYPEMLRRSGCDGELSPRAPATQPAGKY